MLQIIDVLASAGPVLGLGLPVGTHFKHIRAFEQNNGKASRKKLLPFIEQYLRNDTVGSTSHSETPTSMVSGNVVARRIAADMKHQEASDAASRTGPGIDLSLNVVAGTIANDMKLLESSRNHVATSYMSAAESNVVARKITAEMQVQDKVKTPSSEVIVLDCSADTNSRASRKTLGVRYSDADVAVTGSRDGHELPEDQVLAVAEQLVFTAVSAAVDLHLNSTAQVSRDIHSRLIYTIQALYNGEKIEVFSFPFFYLRLDVVCTVLYC